MYNTFTNFWCNGGIERGLQNRRKEEQDGKVLRDYIKDYTIDSCFTFDEGYETAIKKNKGNWIIVENYSSFERMKTGHKKWCKLCEKEQPTAVYSIQTDEVEKF